MQWQGTPQAPQPLTVRAYSTLGDEWTAELRDGCAQLRIGQSAKLKNQVFIDVLAADGRKLGSVTTHDLANRPFTISLGDAGSLSVRPGAHCP